MQAFFDFLNQHPWLFAGFIIVARIIDVSLGTIRTICVVRGYRILAAVLGFIEVILWVTAVSSVLKQVTILKILAYATGFALGNATGIMIERRLAMGQQMVIILSRHYSQAMAFALRLADYIVTELPGKGRDGPVAVCFVVVPRARVRKVAHIARAVDNDAIVITEDVRESTLRPMASGGGPTGWRAVLKKK